MHIVVPAERGDAIAFFDAKLLQRMRQRARARGDFRKGMAHQPFVRQARYHLRLPEQLVHTREHGVRGQGHGHHSGFHGLLPLCWLRGSYVSTFQVFAVHIGRKML
jgi:hypothetical protein